MSVALRSLSVEQWRDEVSRERRFVEPQVDEQGRERLRALFGRDLDADEAVREIVRDVRDRGDDALREWTRRIDGVDVIQVRADRSDMVRAWERTDAAVQDALRLAAERIRDFHALQRDDRVRGDARSLALKPMPLRRAGCYVPGGRAA